MTENTRTPKYQEGDYRRNPNWKRETRKERRARAEATLRRWTPAEYQQYCQAQRELARRRAEAEAHGEPA